MEDGDKKIYDAGENISGVVRIHTKAAKGEKIILRFAEVVDEKLNLDFDSIGYHYVCSSGRKQIMEDVKYNSTVVTYTLGEDGEEKISSSEVYMFISLGLSMIIYMFIAMFSGMVMQSVIEEKSSRVVEVLVSSVKATELMFGKIIGVACVALTQFFLWIVLTLVLVGGFSAFVGFDSLMGDPAQTEQMMEMTAQMGGMDVAEMTAAMQQEDGLGAVLSTLKDINWVQMIFAFIINTIGFCEIDSDVFDGF